MFDPFVSGLINGDELNGAYDQIDGNGIVDGHHQIIGNNINHFDNGFNQTGHTLVHDNNATYFDNNFHQTEHSTQVGNTLYDYDENFHLIGTHTTLPNGTVMHTDGNMGSLGHTDNSGNTFNNLGQKIASFKKIF